MPTAAILSTTAGSTATAEATGISRDPRYNRESGKLATAGMLAAVGVRVRATSQATLPKKSSFLQE